MRVLVWQDHGNIRLLSGSFSDLKDMVLDIVKHYYSEKEMDLISSAKTEDRFAQKVRDITVDDECFEVFEFAEVEEI